MSADRPGAARSHRLRTGESLIVRVIEPPLGPYAARIEYWWRDIRAPLVAGELVATSLDRFFIGEIGGAYVASMTYATSRDMPDIAALEMVWTHPEQRRKGIADLLLAETLADFRALGGWAMYLCTVNPHAAALYQRHGFRPLIGDGMRYLTPGREDFDRTYFADAGPAHLRPGTWGDLARVSALYNQPEPDWLVKDYPRRVFRDMRYEGHYLRVWKPCSQGRGQVLVLENPLGRVVGIASLVEVDSYFEQQIRVLECWACPAYLAQLPALVEALVEEAARARVEIIQAYVAETDAMKLAILAAAGLREEARLAARLRAGNRRVDLLIYSRSLGCETGPARPLGTYYGARPVWRDLPEAADPSAQG
jgi:ribosomal protein S18 acetylase RimI-like enzyme